FQLLRATVVQDVSDLLALLVKDCAAGSIAGEVSAFAVNDQAVVLVSELAHRVLVFGDAHVAYLADERCGLVVQERDVCVSGFAAVVEREAPPNAHGARRRLVLSQSPSAKVNDVDSIVAHLAVAGGPEPMPFVVQLFA